MLWENEMLQQKAVMLGDLFVTVPALISLYFPPFLFIPPFPWQSFSLSFISFPFLPSIAPLIILLYFPCLFSSLSESLMRRCESIHI